MLVDKAVDCSDAFCCLDFRSVTTGQVLSLFQLNQARLQNLSSQYPKEAMSRLRHKHNLVMKFFSFPSTGQILKLPICVCRMTRQGWIEKKTENNLKKKKKSSSNPLSFKGCTNKTQFQNKTATDFGKGSEIMAAQRFGVAE